MARELYEAMETARCEAVGARDMPGTRGNIDAKIGNEAERKGYDQISNAADAPLSDGAGLLIRHLATGRTSARGAERHGALARVHRGAGGRHAGRPAGQAGRPGRLRPLRPPDHRGPRATATSWATTPTTGRRRGRRGQRARDEEESRTAPARTTRARKTRLPPGSSPRTRPRTRPGAGLDGRDGRHGNGRGGRAARGRGAAGAAAPCPSRDADPNYKVYDNRLDEEIRAEELAEPAELERLRAYLDQQLEPLKGAVSAACQQAAAPASGAAEPQLGIRPGGRHPRRRPAGARGGEPDDAAVLQGREGHRVPRHRGDAAARQLRLDAWAADLHRRDLRRRAGPHARTLPREGRDPRLHHARLEGRAEPRELAARGPRAAARPPERPAPHHLQVRRRAMAARAAATSG